MLIEGQEETGGGGIEEFVQAPTPSCVEADAIVIADVGNYALGVPTLTTSLRGMAALDVEVETLAGAVHSGMFGGPAPDALIALCRMLATLHDDDGQRGRGGPGDDRLRRRELRRGRLPHDAGVLPGVDLIGSGTIADRLYGKPSINVIGIDAPGGRRRRQRAHPQGPGPRERAPRARAGPRRGAGPRSAHHLQAAAPWDVRVEGRPRRRRRGVPGAHRRAGLRGRGHAALRAAYGKDVVHYGEGGSIPLVAAFLEAVPGAEMILWGAEEPRSQIHAPDESVDLAELERCVLAEALFINEMAALGRPQS